MKIRRLLKYMLHVAVLLGLGIAAKKYVNGPQFWQSIESFDWRYGPAVCLLGLGSVVVKAWRFSTVLKKVSRVDRTATMVAYVAGQSATLVPGGIAARSAMVDQIGIPPEDSSPAVAISSITDQAGFVLTCLFCAAWFEKARQPALILIGILAAISVLLGIEATRCWLLGVIEAILGRFKLLDKWNAFKESMAKTLTWRLWLVGLLNTFMSFALLVFGLWLCLRGVGASVQWLTVVLAFALPTMLGRISALPGGVGVTEFGMAGILDAAPGVTLHQAVAAVAIFRLSTIVFTAVVGGILYWIAWRPIVRRKKTEQRAVA